MEQNFISTVIEQVIKPFGQGLVLMIKSLGQLFVILYQFFISFFS